MVGRSLTRMKRVFGRSLVGACCVMTVLTYPPAPETAASGFDYGLAAAVSLNMGGTSMGDPGQGYAVAMTRPVSYTHLTLPTICSV